MEKIYGIYILLTSCECTKENTPNSMKKLTPFHIPNQHIVLSALHATDNLFAEEEC